jgi:hypothetical protein
MRHKSEINFSCWFGMDLCPKFDAINLILKISAEINL